VLTHVLDHVPKVASISYGTELELITCGDLFEVLIPGDLDVMPGTIPEHSYLLPAQDHISIPSIEHGLVGEQALPTEVSSAQTSE